MRCASSKDDLIKSGSMTKDDVEKYISLMEENLSKLIEDNGKGKFEILKPITDEDTSINAIYVEDDGAVYGSKIAGEDIGAYSSREELEKNKKAKINEMLKNNEISENELRIITE